MGDECCEGRKEDALEKLDSVVSCENCEYAKVCIIWAHFYKCWIELEEVYHKNIDSEILDREIIKSLGKIV